ncbi:MAG: ribonuclease Z [Thaumarchaeota archaeon]|nr:ribonuclease Z [Nitrososphaerota archaeon]|tara:strand:- start:589 stop:1503 length:915 start_codon:yes stop_codon:yes gene_type:complete
MQLKVILLGTASAMPTYERGLSSTAIVRGGEVMLFDVGEGAQRNFLKSGIGTNRRMKVFITHMHSDHCVGLLGLLQTMSLQNRNMPMQLYGPEQINDFIHNNMKLLNFGFTFPITINTVSEGIVVEESDYVIKAKLANHSIKSYSYCMEERERPGIFYPEKAKTLGIPEGNLWHKLQQGEDIEFNDKIIKSEEVTGPKRNGRKIGISGDTRPDDNLIEFFHDCDLLIFDSTYTDEHKEKAKDNMHSTAREAATLAVKSNVRKIILSHFSARYEDINLLAKEAMEIHSNVVAAEDLLTIEVPYDQ